MVGGMSPGHSGDERTSGDTSSLGQPWKVMADLAEAVDDLICSFDYSYADAAMDTLVMFAFFWLIFALALAWFIKFCYRKYLARKELKPAAEDASVAKKVEVDDKKVAKANEEVNSAVKDGVNVKAKVGAIASKPVVKSSGVVSATPPLKKRLSRMSPGPDVQRKSVSAHHHPPPTCSGPDVAATRWTNALLAWLYSDLVVVNDLLQLWILSMNEYSKKSVEEHGVGIELVRVLTESPAPKISNVFCECDSKDDVTITCDCEATPALQLKAFRQKGDKVEVAHYRVNVNKFRARLNVLCVTEKLNGELRCDGWPDVKVALAPVGPLRTNPDEPQLQEVISEIVVSALRSTQVQYSLAHYPTCPRLRRYSETPSRTMPLHYDSMNPLYAHTGQNEQLLSGDKRLLVKVVSASQLGPCTASYCVLEMDEPPQRNQTSTKRDTGDPLWDEHFLFELSPHTAEILLEVFDKGVGQQAPRFLGLGIVGIEELLISPSQRQVIRLQARPLQDDPVTGTLTVEFLFIEGADIPLMEGRPFKLKETLKTVSPTGQTLTTTRTMFKQDGTMNGNAQLTQSALRELERSPVTQANKSTLIIHSVQRTPKQTKVEITDSGEFIEVEQTITEQENKDSQEKNGLLENGEVKEETVKKEAEPELNTTPLSRSSEKKVTVDVSRNVITEEISNGGNKDEFDGKDEFGLREPGDLRPNQVYDNGQPPERIPRQKKKRDFFGTIKRRLGRSRTRARSVDVPDSENEERPNGRSISADRNHFADNSLNVPSPSRNIHSGGPSSTSSPIQSGDESRNSRRSSISEMSGVSGASTRTYLHEASTLVLETTDNGVRKHFLVPLNIAQRSRWRRKGTKLHIFNDHTFVAKHLAGGIVCQVCNKNIARRIGKQGYECRDCLMQCHKHCHVRVVHNCAHSTIHTIELDGTLVAHPNRYLSWYGSTVVSPMIKMDDIPEDLMT